MSVEKHYSVGVDFGTWSSGFSCQDIRLPVNPWTRDWASGVANSPSGAKTRSAVILNIDDQLAHAEHGAGSGCFSWASTVAEELLERGQRFRRQYQLHERFKLGLLNENPKPLFRVCDGTELDVKVVITEYLKWFFRETMRALERKIGVTDQREILWVFTVPCLYALDEKRVMTEAARAAGFLTGPNDLIFVQEPEAAALWVIQSAMKEEEESFAEDEVVLILDAGGGTIDVSCHRLLGNLRLSEISISSSDAKYASAQINDQMLEYLETTYPDAVEELQDDDLAFAELKVAIESGKVLFTGRIDVPIHVRTHHLKIPKRQMMQIFRPSLEAMKRLIDKQFERVGTVDHLVCVGGFSESEVIYAYLRRQYGSEIAGGESHVRRPSSARSAVVFGASLYGQDPTSVAWRMSRVTYGISAKVRYDPDHPLHRGRQSQVVTVGNYVYLPNVFMPFIREGDPVEDGEESDPFGPFDPMRRLEFQVYSTEKDDVHFVDELVDVGTQVSPQLEERLRRLRTRLRRVRTHYGADVQVGSLAMGDARQRSVTEKLQRIAQDFGCRVDQLRTLVSALAPRAASGSAPSAASAASDGSQAQPRPQAARASGSAEPGRAEEIAQEFGVSVDELTSVVTGGSDAGDSTDAQPQDLTQGSQPRHTSRGPTPLLSFVIECSEADLQHIRAVYLQFLIGRVRLQVRKIIEYDDDRGVVAEIIEGEIPLKSGE